jgi:hypothetical protein
MSDLPIPRPPYVPPRPSFFRCRCGALVLRVQGKGPPLTPCLGLPHVCKRIPEGLG